MKHSIACPMCAASFQVGSDPRGKKAACPRCGERLVVTGDGRAHRDEPRAGSPTVRPVVGKPAQARRERPARPRRSGKRITIAVVLALVLLVQSVGIAWYLLTRESRVRSGKETEPQAAANVKAPVATIAEEKQPKKPRTDEDALKAKEAAQAKKRQEDENTLKAKLEKVAPAKPIAAPMPDNNTSMKDPPAVASTPTKRYDEAMKEVQAAREASEKADLSKDEGRKLAAAGYRQALEKLQGLKTLEGLGPNQTKAIADSIAAVRRHLEEWVTVAVLQGHSGAVFCVAFSPDSQRLLSGSGDKTAKVWDILSAQETLCYTGHKESVTSVAYCDDANRVASYSLRLLNLWDSSNGTTDGNYEGPYGFRVNSRSTFRHLAYGQDHGRFIHFCLQKECVFRWRFIWSCDCMLPSEQRLMLGRQRGRRWLGESHARGFEDWGYSRSQVFIKRTPGQDFEPGIRQGWREPRQWLLGRYRNHLGYAGRFQMAKESDAPRAHWPRHGRRVQW